MKTQLINFYENEINNLNTKLEKAQNELSRNSGFWANTDNNDKLESMITLYSYQIAFIQSQIEQVDFTVSSIDTAQSQIDYHTQQKEKSHQILNEQSEIISNLETDLHYTVLRKTAQRNQIESKLAQAKEIVNTHNDNVFKLSLKINALSTLITQ